MVFVRRILPILAALAVGPGAAPAGAQERMVESIVPALQYGPSCSSVVELRNLGEKPAAIEVEGHKASGALVSLAGRPGTTVQLAAGERGSYKLEIPEETKGAWVKVRERVRGAAPVVAVGGTTECVVANQLRTVRREVAFATRNPWFSSDTAEPHGSLISLINTSEHAAKAALCYSSGGLFSVPGGSRPSARLEPICSTGFEVQVPPFGSREFPAEWDGSSHFSLKTEGNAIVLEMLRPVEANVRVYAVDSIIKFGGEVPEGPIDNRPQVNHLPHKVSK
jgi:hypothetical protein